VTSTAGGQVPESDGELVGLARTGAPADFLNLFWRHGPAVHAYLARRTGRQDADDLLGDVWLRAFRGRENYDPRWPDARPWLYGIARNVLRAHWRNAGRHGGAHLEAVVSDPWPDADSRIDAAAQGETLRQILATLSDDDREVLLLVTWEQLTPAEVAVTLGIPQGTARSRLHRALSVLRLAMASDPAVPTSTHLKER
jgi:RNA polymerase sigma factor (sigma-70 family)